MPCPPRSRKPPGHVANTHRTPGAEEPVEQTAAGTKLAMSMTERELDHASTVSLHPTLEVRAFPRKVTVPTDDLRRALQAERRPPMSTGR